MGTVRNSRLLFSLSLSLGLPASAARLSLTGKTHPVAGEMLESLWMIIACGYTGFMHVLLSQDNCLFGYSNQGNRCRGYLWERACLLKDVGHLSSEVSHQQCMLVCFRLVHKRTHTEPQGAHERSVCLQDTTCCRQGWTPSSGLCSGAVVGLDNKQNIHTASNLLNRNYSDYSDVYCDIACPASNCSITFDKSLLFDTHTNFTSIMFKMFLHLH